jgi:hypothetical protein
MIKVVYFDDNSATDYLNIYDGGKVVRTSDDIENQNSELGTRVSSKLFAKLSWLPFIGGEAEVGASAGLSLNSSSLIKTTLSNTVLTDFLEKVKNDTTRIIKFDGFRVKAYTNSIAFFKMFTPYLKITKSDFTSEGFTFDLARMDEAFESGKGYYELISEKDSNKYIFRFNIEAFRNNYGIADLTKMNLSYYGIKVGSADVNLLDINKEFNFEQGNINSAFDIEETQAKPNELDVYDILLAGICV